MKKFLFFIVVLLTLCAAESVYAGNNGWKKTLEQKYADSGVEGDDPYITAETYYFYDADNNLVLETMPESNKRTMYIYDDSNLCTSKMSMVYDQELKQWFGSVLEAYTYDADGKLKTVTASSFDFDGNMVAAKAYKHYSYDVSGNLVKEEQRQIGTDAVTAYTEYFYENGRKVMIKGYKMSGSEASLISENDYTYNPDGTVSEMLCKELVFTIDKFNLTNRSKEVYTYTDGKCSQTMVYVPKTSDYSIWIYSKKYNYKYDPNSGLVASMTNASAKNNMQTGEFLEWRQMNRTDYIYSNALGAERTPSELAYRVKSSKVMLAWKAPSVVTGLTGFRIYKDYVLLTTVDAAQTGFTDAQVKEGAVYDYFVQSVYNDSIQNISSVVSVKVTAGGAENPWKMTLEQKYIDSGAEGDDPYVNSQTYYFYDQDNNLTARSVPEDFMRSSYAYDHLGRLTGKTGYIYDEESRTWQGTTRTEYTYHPDGRLRTEAECYYDREKGEFATPGMYSLYMYATDGALIKKEDRIYASHDLISYVAYSYEGGLKSVEKYYVIDGGSESLSEEITFMYNEDKTLSQTIDQMFQPSVDPDKLTNVKKEVYTYENGFLKELVAYQPKANDNADWTFNQKFDYKFDSQSRQMATCIFSLADLNMDSGEFIGWKQVTRTEYSYTDLLGADKMPKNLEGKADGGGVHLVWNAPDYSSGLTAYHVFRNYQLLETLSAENTRYTDLLVKNDLAYDYFIQPVYNENVLMNISPVISVKGMTVGIKECPVAGMVCGVNAGIEIIGQGLVSFEIYSTDGTLRLAGKADGDHVVASGLEKGIYVVSVTSREGVYRQKVSVK